MGLVFGNELDFNEHKKRSCLHISRKNYIRDVGSIADLVLVLLVHLAHWYLVNWYLVHWYTNWYLVHWYTNWYLVHW